MSIRAKWVQNRQRIILMSLNLRRRRKLHLFKIVSIKVLSFKKFFHFWYVLGVLTSLPVSTILKLLFKAVIKANRLLLFERAHKLLDAVIDYQRGKINCTSWWEIRIHYEVVWHAKNFIVIWNYYSFWRLLFVIKIEHFYLFL